jgi:hypothetical protein
MITLTTILSAVLAILTKASSVFTHLSKWKWKRRESKKTVEDSKRVRKIVKDGDVDAINDIYRNRD